MNLGSALLLFGIDLELLQGIVNHIYGSDPSFRTVEGEDGAFRLELDGPVVETRDDAGSYRMGLHLTGRLFVGDQPDALVFDTWVRLAPEAVEVEGTPVGTIAFDDIEDVVPAFAEPAVRAAFEPDGFIGTVLADLAIPAFEGLIESAAAQLFPGQPVDPSRFSSAFYLGHPASIRRPVWTMGRVDGDWEPVLDLDVSHGTVPALIASVALDGSDPVPPEAPSIVRRGTGLGLVTSASLFAARFAIESAAVVGTTIEGLTMDRLDVASTDYGFDVEGAGHKTGAEVSFAGSLVAVYRGGTGGDVVLRSNVETDVDLAWWVELASIVAAILPGIGWFLGDLFIWGPAQEAPGQIDAALLDKFSAPLSSAAEQLTEAFDVDDIPTSAHLADVWFFDGNMAVAAAAFAGTRTDEIHAVTHDVAYVVPNPAEGGDRTNRKRPVRSVAEVTLASGHILKPWQAGQLVLDGAITIPGHHAVRNPLATGGVYLRSDPDDTTSNNLLR